MTELEAWILNEMANEILAAMKTGWQDVIDECQKDYNAYFAELQTRIASRRVDSAATQL